MAEQTEQQSLVPFAEGTKSESLLKVPGGLYLTFEGPEGSGKTTQIQLLAERLAKEGYSVVRTKQPGGTEVGVAVRQILLHPDYKGKILPHTESLLFWADRFQHHETIVKPAMRGGCIVLSDRDFDSSWVYQVHGRGLPAGWMSQIHASVIGDFKPSHTLLFDGPVDKLLARAQKRNEQGPTATESRFDDEQLEFHKRVREGYLVRARAEPGRFIIIDALPGVHETHEQTYLLVKRIIARHLSGA